MKSLRQTQKRQIFNILVVGDQKVGKTALINSLIGSNFAEKTPATSTINITAAEVTFPSGINKVLIFTEIPLIQLNSLTPAEIDKDYDLIAACFENPNHLLRFLNENFLYLPRYVPKIGVHCKNDKVDFEVYMSIDDEKEVQSYGIKKIVECSAKNGETRDFLNAIFEIISKPYILLLFIIF